MAKNRGYIRNNKQKMIVNNVKPKQQQGKYDLSICMIVKNEEKYLERCLKALSVLKQYISCEIIVTDTGSTDNTIGIAKQYADKLLHFEWCDDFSAARNTGINVAEGSWLLNVDADEIADGSIIEIANFMKNPKRDEYDCAYITIRNYKNEDSYELIDILKGSRLLNLTYGKRYFQGPIHEFIPVTINRFDVPAHFHHYGYIEEISHTKSKRNRSYLEKILEKNPDDVDALKYLMDSERDVRRKIEMCLSSIELMKTKNLVDDFIHSFYVSACKSYVKLREFDNFLELAEKYLDYLGDLIMYPRMEMLFLIANVYKELECEKSSSNYYEKYVETYLYLQKNPDFRYAGIDTYNYAEHPSYLAASLVVAKYEGEFGDPEKARKFIIDADATNYSPNGSTYPFIMDVIETTMIIGDGDIIFEAYNKGYEVFAKKTRSYLAQVVNKSFYKLVATNDNQRVEKFLKSFTSHEREDSFIILNKLRLYDYDFSKLSENEIEILKNEKELFASDIFIDVAYATIINGVDSVGFYENTTKLEAETLISGLFQFRSNSHDDMYNWIKNIKLEEIKDLRKLSLYNFIASCILIKKVSIIRANEVTQIKMIDEVEEMLEYYVKGTTVYINTVYKPEILQDMHINALPINEAFAFMVNKIIDKKHTEQAEYLAGLKEAVAYYPTMKPCIQLIADKFKKLIENDNEVVDQFQELGKQVKQMLRMIIRQGNKEQALQILEQYRGINPTDVDIANLEQEIELYTK